MIQFSYGQIGVIQALAGFFTYMIVLNDYGYPPSTLINRGHSEVWGHQPLFCKFKGGNYVNLRGDINEALNPSVDPPTRTYPFWDHGLDGEIISVSSTELSLLFLVHLDVMNHKLTLITSLLQCGYAYNNFAGEGKPTSEFDFRDSKTYSAQTRGRHTGTIESYEALEQNHFFEYIPNSARASSFWDDKYLSWNTNDSNGPGNLGENVETLPYFGGRPAGLWSLCEQITSSECEDHSFCGDQGSAEKRGAHVPATVLNADPSRFVFSDCSNQGEMTDRLYDQALFCNGQGSETLSVSGCTNVNQYSPGIAYPNNSWQAFYCMGFNSDGQDSCGLLTDDAESLPFCDINGNVCGTFNDKESDCNYMCQGYCYWPGSEATNPNKLEQVSTMAQFQNEVPGTDGQQYQQCLNIASSESAYEALKYAQGAFFISIVIGQMAGLLVCKTRWLSFFKQGMKNTFMLFAIGSEIALVCLLAYVPQINNAIGTRPIKFIHWLPAIPFAIFIFCFDEIRKALMRATSKERTDPMSRQTIREMGWIEKNFAY